MTEAPDYSICDLAQKYADMYPERPSGHLATHHSERMSAWSARITAESQLDVQIYPGWGNSKHQNSM